MDIHEELLKFAKLHPSDFTLQYPPRREYFMDNFTAEVSERMAAGFRAQTSANAYLHVPFCEAKCSYCNFAVVTRNSDDIHQSYMNTLLRSVENLVEGSNLREFATLDIGGGTPTLVSPEVWEHFFTKLDKVVEVSRSVISIETTPRIAAKAGTMEFFANRCARASMGIQTTEASMLADLNRQAQAQVLDEALKNLTNAGFERTNVDLIFGLPGQTMKSWLDDVKMAIDSGVTSITTYDCLYRGKGRVMTKKLLTVPTPDSYGRMYDAAREVLMTAGFTSPYGSVNHSRIAGETGTSPYFENRLLHGEDFVGFGNYATSIHGQEWMFAPAQLARWTEQVKAGAKLPEGFGYHLPIEEVMTKHALLSLSFGVLQDADFTQYGFDTVEQAFPNLAVAEQNGWMGHTAQGWGVAEGSFKNMAQLRSLFYTPQSAGWLMDLQH